MLASTSGFLQASGTYFPRLTSFVDADLFIKESGSIIAQDAFYIDQTLFEERQRRCGRPGTWVKVEPKVMEFICALCRNPFRLYTRGELLDVIWPNGLGSDESLTRLAYQARSVFKKAGANPDLIKTIAGAGYMLDASVNHLGSAEAKIEAGDPHSEKSLAHIAVLQFVDPLGNTEENYLIEGLTRDLTALLSRVPGFLVAPYSSAVRIDPKSTPDEVIADMLDAQFLVSGTLHRRHNDLRLRVSLSDARARELIWAERYDTTLDKFFEIQDETVITISSTISAGLKWSTPDFALSGRSFSDPVYRRLQKSEQLRINYSHASAQEIERLLREARDLAPNNTAVLTGLGVQISQSMVSGWSKDYEVNKQEALTLIGQALSLDPANPDVLSAAGVVATMLHRPHDAIEYLSRAQKANPSDAHAMAVLGWQTCLHHNDSTGIALLDRAEKRAPHHPRFGLWATYRGTAHLFMLDYAAALPVCQAAMVRTPGYYQPFLTTAWAIVGLARDEEAKPLIAKACLMEGDTILSKFVDEMKLWAANSPNSQECFEVLDRLASLS